MKKQYNLQEASVALERCDKIWDTMQLLKRAQESYTAEEDTDDENEQENWAKSSHRTSDSVSSSMTTGAITYIKYEPTQGNGNNALPNFYLSVKKQTKIYNCGTCGKIYNEKRAFRIHVKRDHGIAAVPDEAQVPKHSNNSETRLTRPKTPQTDTSSVDGDRALKTRLLSGEAQYQCPVCKNLYTYKGRLRTHALEVHGLDIPANKEISVKTEKKRGRQTECEEISYVYTHARINNMKRYLFFCITCHKEFCDKQTLRTHMVQSHRIKIPKGPEGSLSGLFIRGIESSRQYLRRLRLNRDSNVTPLPPKSKRAGPLSSKTSNRPKRACTINTCYTEATKEEEEIWEYDEIAGHTKNQPASSGHLSKCFLCQKSCVDMPLHLKDYHRISKPDSILPLNEQLSTDPICKENYNEAIKIEAKQKSQQKDFADAPQSTMKRISAKNCKNWDLLNEQMKSLYKIVPNTLKGSEEFQCLLCNSIFTKIGNLKVHLATKMKNGVVQKHKPSGRRKYRSKALKNKKDRKEKAMEDPLKLDAKSIVDSESSSTKRRLSYSDASSSTSEVMPFKRKKIELAKASESNDKSSDCESEESEEEEKEDKVIRKSENNARYDRVDGTVNGDSGTDKSSLDQRDTRESSDRDSGIGISITIKKRNNSYEVVERDNCEADKVEDEEVSKDENVISSDSSSDTTTTNSNYRNGHEIAGASRTRELFDPLDCSREPSIDKATRGRDDDDITVIESTHSTLSRTTEQMNKQNVRSSHKASAEIPGNVPSLKLLCRNLLKRHPVSCFTENHVNSHQCPVCCRFYSTERDVTVHMTKHRVNINIYLIFSKTLDDQQN